MQADRNPDTPNSGAPKAPIPALPGAGSGGDGVGGGGLATTPQGPTGGFVGPSPPLCAAAALQTGTQALALWVMAADRSNPDPAPRGIYFTALLFPEGPASAPGRSNALRAPPFSTSLLRAPEMGSSTGPLFRVLFPCAGDRFPVSGKNNPENGH